MAKINIVVHMEEVIITKWHLQLLPDQYLKAGRLWVFVTPYKAEKAGHSQQKSLHFQGKQTTELKKMVYKKKIIILGFNINLELQRGLTCSVALSIAFKHNKS